MAIMPPFSAGTPCFKGTNGTSQPHVLQFGPSVTIIVAAASVSAQLPVDPNTGKLYEVYRLTCNAICWFNFNTAGDAAVAGAANNHLFNPQYFMEVRIPPGQTPGATAQASCIADGGGAVKLCITGLF